MKRGAMKKRYDRYSEDFVRQAVLVRSSWFLPIVAVALLGCMPADAALIVSMSPVTVAAGTSDATFEVDLQNTGSVQKSCFAGLRVGQFANHA